MTRQTTGCFPFYFPWNVWIHTIFEAFEECATAANRTTEAERSIPSSVGAFLFGVPIRLIAKASIPLRRGIAKGNISYSFLPVSLNILATLRGARSASEGRMSRKGAGRRCVPDGRWLGSITNVACLLYRPNEA